MQLDAASWVDAGRTGTQPGIREMETGCGEVTVSTPLEVLGVWPEGVLGSDLRSRPARVLVAVAAMLARRWAVTGPSHPATEDPQGFLLLRGEPPCDRSGSSPPSCLPPLWPPPAARPTPPSTRRPPRPRHRPRRHRPPRPIPRPTRRPVGPPGRPPPWRWAASIG